LASLRDTKLVDYPGVWTAKQRAFEALFSALQARLAGGAEDPETADFRDFVAEGGPVLQNLAVFSVLDELHCDTAGRAIPWHRWPLADRAPDGPTLDRVVGERPDRIMFFKYLQYLADRRLQEAAHQARQTGLEIGLVRDMALGTNPDGADAWMAQNAFVRNLRCGAPGDAFHPHGQEWGVIPLNPIALRRDYSPLIAMLRANMRHAGGLRVDHIRLQRQFLVSAGAEKTPGCYVRFPFEEMTAVLELESQRNACMVIGEDLGTVPEGFRDRMREKKSLGCAILYFNAWTAGVSGHQANILHKPLRAPRRTTCPRWSDIEKARTSPSGAGLQSTPPIAPRRRWRSEAATARDCSRRSLKPDSKFLRQARNARRTLACSSALCTPFWRRHQHDCFLPSWTMFLLSSTRSMYLGRSTSTPTGGERSRWIWTIRP
jgi:hypothetical protein